MPMPAEGGVGTREAAAAVIAFLTWTEDEGEDICAGFSLMSKGTFISVPYSAIRFTMSDALA